MNTFTDLITESFDPDEPPTNAEPSALAMSGALGDFELLSWEDAAGLGL